MAINNDDLKNDPSKDDRNVFDGIYNAHKVSIYNLCYHATGNHEDAEDIAATVFLHFWQQIKKVNDARHAKNLLYLIARRRIADFWRTHVKFIDYQDAAEWLADPLDESSLKRLELELADMYQQAMCEIDELPDQCKLIFKSFALDHKDPTTIAKELNVSRSTVDNQIANAREKISKGLRQKGFGDLLPLLWLFYLFY